jgi:hypothetical protein
MKTLYPIAFSVLLATGSLQAESNTPAKDTIWSQSSAEGGDASSSCYHFIGRQGNVVRVRILYVAAYSHEASGTDYFVEGSSIRVDKIRGAKAKEAQQIEGKDDGITVTATYTLTTKSAQDALISSLGNEQLNMAQKLDLSELIRILKDCVPAKNEEGKQDSADQPATAPESKPEGKDKPQPEAKPAPR